MGEAFTKDKKSFADLTDSSILSRLELCKCRMKGDLGTAKGRVVRAEVCHIFIYRGGTGEICAL